MLEIFNRQRKLIGLLQNAYGLSEELKINSVNYFKFSLPHNDTKNELCKPFNFVRYNSGQLYRILPSETTLGETGDISYKCEHVLALLIDNVMFGDHVVGNRGYYTREVLEYVLSKQLERNWILGDCDFSREFEYGWTGETLLSALFQVPKPFTKKYIWTFNTNTYPYILNLKEITENINPQLYIRAKKNMLQLSKTSDPTNICTRLYPLGEGEGINQLNIKRITGGLPYIQSPQEYLDRYGIVERIWIDRRYTNEESLYEAAVAMLHELQEPFEEYQADFALLGEDYFDVPELGKIVEIVGFKKTYITGIDFTHDEIKSSTISIANKPKDIAGTIADMQDRQRIEMTYSQGATQFYQDHVYDNADPGTSLVLKLMLPSDMKIINAIKIDVEIGPFRKPFTVTGGGGGQTISQSNTTSSGASSENTTLGGGGQTISQSNTTSSGSSSENTTLGGGGQTISQSNTSSSGASSITTTADGGGQTSGSSSSNTTSTGGVATSGPSNINTTADGGGKFSSTNGGGGGTSDEPVATLSSSNVSLIHSNGGHNHGIDGNTKIATTNDSEEKVTGSINLSRESSHTHTMFGHYHKLKNHAHDINLPDHNHPIGHTHSIGTHGHGMSHTHNIYSHTHDMRHYHDINHTHYIPSHVHDMRHYHDIQHTHSIPDHVHDMRHHHDIQHTHNIPDHIHELNPGISFGGNPSGFYLMINGQTKTFISAMNLQQDITDFLLDERNMIPRNVTHKIEILPNDSAFVMLTVSVQGFIQSRGNRTV